jgi:midasin (ATPase involved in ribosome maturation)
LRIINYYLNIDEDMSNVSENKLNIFKLKTLIDSGIASIPVDKKHNNAVLVIGDTGVGKTTILSFLAKRKLYIKIHGLNTILDSDDHDGLKIGHDRFSETRVPSKIIVDNLVFFDCSGFKDNRGE